MVTKQSIINYKYNQHKRKDLPILKIIITISTWSTNSSLEIFKRHFKRTENIVFKQLKSTHNSKFFFVFFCYVFFNFRLQA